ncbi:MAG: hypothetical protein L0Y71_19210 [Gemmataceae bacterium]|nr:hypothetical protein [Gemmataceae bacterium]
MSTIILDADLRAKLNGLSERIDVRDEAGDIVGHFLPTEEYYRLLCKTIEIPYTKEEIARRRAEKGGRTLAEIWKELDVK